MFNCGAFLSEKIREDFQTRCLPQYPVDTSPPTKSLEHGLPDLILKSSSDFGTNFHTFRLQAAA